MNIKIIIILVPKEVPFKANIHFKILRFPLTLTLMSPKLLFKAVVFKWLQYENNRQQEATIKLYIA